VIKLFLFRESSNPLPSVESKNAAFSPNFNTRIEIPPLVTPVEAFVSYQLEEGASPLNG